MLNYLDRFTDAEDYIRNEVAANRGNRTLITKKELLQIASDHGITADARMSKAEIYDRLRQKLDSAKLLTLCSHLGIRSVHIQDRFKITHSDVKKLEKSGFLMISGYETVRLYGKYVRVPLYNPFQVYDLTTEDVQAELNKIIQTGLTNGRFCAKMKL